MSVQARRDFTRADELGLTNKNRWEEGIPHHPMSKRIVEFLVLHDFNDYNDHFSWRIGEDDANGEILMYQMDAFFEMLDSSGHAPEEPIRMTKRDTC